MTTFLTVLLVSIVKCLLKEENVKALERAIIDLIDGEPSQEVKSALEDLKKEPSEDMLAYVGKILEKETNITPEQYGEVLVKTNYV